MDQMDAEHVMRMKQLNKVVAATEVSPTGPRQTVNKDLTRLRDWMLAHNNDVLEFDAFHGVYKQRYLSSWRSVVD